MITNHKTSVSLFIFIVLCCSKNLWAQEAIKIETTKIESVTVYDGCAQVTRTFSCDIKEGRSSIEFKIPKDLVDLQRLKISSNSTQTKCVSLYVDNEPPSLTNKINETEPDKTNSEIKNKIKILEAEILSQQNALEMLEKLKERLLDNFGKDASKEKIDIEEWKASLKILKEKAIAIASKTRELEIKKWQLERESENISQPTIKNVNKAEMPSLKITAELKALKAEKVQFTFKYFVKGPTWRPEYEIKYDSTLQKLTFQYFAKVTQFTGEDWLNAPIILSTVNLEDVIAMPDAPKKYLDSFAAEKPTQRIKTNKEKISEIAVKEDNDRIIVKKILANDENKADHQKANEDGGDMMEGALIDQGISTEIPLKNVNIYSVFEVQKIVVNEKQLEFKSRIELAPAETKDAYRRLTFINNLSQIILPGNAHLFLNGKPLGKVTLPLILPTAETSISFGNVQGLYGIKQIEELDKKESKLENDKMRIIKYKLNLRNFNNEKITFRLYDMIPVSKIKDVSINFNENEEGFTTQIPGLIFQDITLNPKEGKQIKIKYTMESKGDYSF